ncbi:twin-arginine translocase TatA/TatE family subunit [Ancylomarina sp.]|uniref:twin-arginine translocase TatA/TatE family subunit n=1 Tax=Ancylomarina sp. TaxID=1970196 RepID=UPI003564AE27
MLLFISGPEIIIVLLVVVMLFGAKKIPELAKGLGKGMQEFKKATDDIKREIKDESDIVNNLKDFKDDLSKKL